MTVQRGDIVIVDYPYSDRSGSKVRPALVVQSDSYNGQLSDTILALVSSSRARFVGAASQLPVDVATPEGQQSGLRLASVIQCENLVTLDQQFILRTIGRLSPGLMQKVDACLRSVLGLP
jgi:mRNA interferase MazF